MPIFDLVFWGIILVSALVGALQGFWIVAYGLAGVVLGYLGAYAYGREVGTPIVRSQGWPDSLAILVGGALVFIGCVVFFRIVRFVHHLRRRRKDRGLSRLDRFGGFLVGGLKGAAVSVLLILGTGLIPRGHPLRESIGLENSPTHAHLEPLARQASRLATRMALGDSPTAPLVTAAMEKPEETARELSSVMKSEAARELATDESFRDLMESGDTTKVAGHPAFERFVESPEADGLMEYLEVSSGTTIEPENARRFWAGGIETYMSVANSEDFERLMKDPEIRRKVEQRDIGGLMRDPRVREALLAAGAREGSDASSN